MSSLLLDAQVPPDALILAGGLGSRLRAVVPDCQKVVAPIDGEPFLTRILRNLQTAGVRRVILALGYLAGDVMAAIAPMTPAGMTLIPSIEETPLGTGGAIRHALALIGTEEVLVANGDSVIDYPLADFIAFHRHHQARASMLLCEVPDVSRYGTVTLDGYGRISSFHEKQANAHHPGIINAGVYLMTRTLIAGFPETPHSLETAVLPGLCGDGLHGLSTNAPFIDIGTPDDYGRASAFFSKTN